MGLRFSFWVDAGVWRFLVLLCGKGLSWGGVGSLGFTWGLDLI